MEQKEQKKQKDQGWAELKLEARLPGDRGERESVRRQEEDGKEDD